MKRLQKKQFNRQPIHINIDPSDLKEVHCPGCGCSIFANGETIRYLSAIIAPNGKEGFAFFPTKYCVRCQHAVDLKTTLKEIDTKIIEE